MQETGINPWVGKIPWRREWLPTPVFLPRESHGQGSLAGYSPWSCKESYMTEWLSLFTYIYSILTIFKWCTLHPVALSTFIMECNHHLEKAMTPHSSTLAWNIPRMEEPGRLQSMGLLGVGHYWATSLSLFTFMHWRRKWQPVPVFLPGESQGQGSLVGCRLWGHTESDTTEVTLQQQQPSPPSIHRTVQLEKLQLYPLNTNSPSPSSDPDNHPSASCLSEFANSRWFVWADALQPEEPSQASVLGISSACNALSWLTFPSTL